MEPDSNPRPRRKGGFARGGRARRRRVRASVPSRGRGSSWRPNRTSSKATSTRFARTAELWRRRRCAFCGASGASGVRRRESEARDRGDVFGELLDHRARQRRTCFRQCGEIVGGRGPRRSACRARRRTRRPRARAVIPCARDSMSAGVNSRWPRRAVDVDALEDPQGYSASRSPLAPRHRGPRSGLRSRSGRDAGTPGPARARSSSRTRAAGRPFPERGDDLEQLVRDPLHGDAGSPPRRRRSPPPRR